ncbi:MAG: Hpt domain-containing protein [Bacteroidales bacterium]|nr:Hpt domain-containing protein [Bacteroidales bacterium]
MINEEKFEETYEIFDKETVVEIIDLFIKEYDSRIDKITLHLDSVNFSELQKCAHAFKGVISNFETECKAYEEISEIENQCRDLMMSNRNLDEKAAKELAEQLSKIFVSFKKNSKQILNQLKEMRMKYTT